MGKSNEKQDPLERGKPKDHKNWRWEDCEECEDPPPEVAWGTGQPLVEDGKRLRNRAVHSELASTESEALTRSRIPS